jgi:iron complex transport system substrate-binding protein
VPSPSPSPVSYPLTVTDDEGTTVVIPARPMHIVSLTPATTEVIYALGAADRFVGDTDSDDYPPAATKVAHVATFNSVDVEKIVTLGTDLVIAGGDGFNPPASIAQLRKLGVPVIVVYGSDLNGVLHDIDLVGEAIGDASGAADLTASMRAGFDQIQAATASLPHPRVFYEIDATKQIYGPADKSFIAQMIEFAGGTPITTGSTTVFSIPLETLVFADPQIIVMGDSNYGTTAADVEGRPGWGTMSAVIDRAIVPIDDTVVTRPGPRLVEGLGDLALAIHPGLNLPPLPSASPGAVGSAAPSSAPSGSAAPAASASPSPAPSAT